jgi:aspartate oxidase
MLVDAHGEPVMAGVHPMGDLAPRDVVAAREAQVMAEQGTDRLFLDARSIGKVTLERRFPTVLAGCRAAGIDPVTEPIPVRPAQHYSCGGVAADLDGRTSLTGLFAVGEVACTGVHGANRLASNSLLEGLDAGTNAARLLREDLPARRQGVAWGAGARVVPQRRDTIAQAMQADAGVLRSGEALARLASLLEVTGPVASDAGTLATWEATNLHTLSSVLVNAAQMRTESRGCHRRADLPDPCDAWAVHLDTVVEPGSAATTETAVRHTELGAG